MRQFTHWGVCFLLVLIGCSSAQPGAIDEEQTRRVMEHHWKAFKENDLNAVMEDYTEESFLITPGKTYKGLKAIRENFVQAFKAFPTDENPLTLKKMVIEQDVGYIIWQARTSSMNLRFATDTFVIRDGKIVRQTYGGISQNELEETAP